MRDLRENETRRQMLNHFGRLLSLYVVLALLLAGALAPRAARPQEGYATVRVDGQALFRLGALDNEDAKTRARRAEESLTNALDSLPAPLLVRRVPAASPPGSEEITVAGRRVVLVTPTDAEGHGVTVAALSEQWSSVIERALAQAAERRRSTWDRFVNAIQSSVQTAFASILESAIVVVPRAIAAALVIAVFWLIASVVRWLIRLIFRRIVSDLTVENLIKQIAYYAVWALGMLVAATAFGLDPEALATGLGLTSLALGFALKDILSNFVSGLLILTLRPFRLGDQIVIGPTEGSVERIELRATMIRTYDGRMISVPNSETFTSRVTNNTASPIRRGTAAVHLGYSVTLPLAFETIHQATQQAEGVLDEPPSSVRLRSLEQDHLVLEARFWTDSLRSDYVLTASRVRVAILDGLRGAGVPLPDSVVQVDLRPRHDPDGAHGPPDSLS
jgi:small-conductance mechanosensitive channel